MAQIFSQRPFNRFGAGVLEPDITRTLAYQQAGLPRQREMQQLVGMGLPANTDISRVRVAGYTPYFTPIYSAPEPQAFGTFGALSAGDVSGTGPFRNSVWREEQRQAAAIQRAATTRNQQPEPEPTPEGYIRNRFGYLEPKEWYTQDGRKKTEQEYRGARKNKETNQAVPAMPEQNNSWRMSLLGGAPTLSFPFTNY